MEQQLTSNSNLNNFLQERHNQILDIAQKNTEEIVKKELALMDFELLLAVTTTEKDNQKLTDESRELRKENWDELEKKSKGDYDKMNELLNQI